MRIVFVKGSGFSPAESNGVIFDLEKALSELKSTKNRFIQSEKITSCSELITGIVHEIQNQINFVNNFAEVVFQNVIGKIFQPFFTTRPPGQGTGLGLSLSYDIIKAHSAELTAETKEGAFAEFIIQMPIEN